MVQKIVEVEGIGPLLLAKRRGSRNIRLSVLPDGRVRVGLPAWAPYSAGIDFAKRRADWIIKHTSAHQLVALEHGDAIGKSYRLYFRHNPRAAKTSTRLGANSVNVTSSYSISHPTVQQAAGKASERALKREAERLLPARVAQLAAGHGFSYRQVRIKKLSSRWGSCSSDKVITLNYFLMQLPWHLIDYVIMHELLHTKHLNHSPAFWQSFEEHLPGAKLLRAQIRSYRPALKAQPTVS